MQRYYLELIAFLSGASVMVLEIVGSRILAPYLGTSIFIWTSLIGIILGSLSLGYWWGGQLSDRRPEAGLLSLILFGAALWTGLLSLWTSPALAWIVTTVPDIRLAAVVAALVFFLLPSVLLGMVSPFAVRLKMQTVDSSGSTVGRLYAVSTIGSILGTFGSGFFLIPFFPNPHIILMTALVLGVTSFLAQAERLRVLRATTMVLLAGLFAFPSILSGKVHPNVIDVNTLYSRVWVYDLAQETEQGTVDVRFMRIGNEGGGATYTTFWGYPYEYARFFNLGFYFNPGHRKALMIGGGAYNYPLMFLQVYRRSSMDVVEIDPAVTRIAREYFFLEDDPRLRIFHQDGRVYLNQTDETYDVVFVDAFRSNVPHHLVTREAVQLMYDILTEDGVVVANLIGTISGPKSELLRSIYTTFADVFPQVYFFPVDNRFDGEQYQNVTLVASKMTLAPSFTSDNERMARLLSHRWTQPVPPTPILRDDFAPLERYQLKTLPMNNRSIVHLMQDLESAKLPQPSP